MPIGSPQSLRSLSRQRASSSLTFSSRPQRTPCRTRRRRPEVRAKLQEPSLQRSLQSASEQLPLQAIHRRRRDRSSGLRQHASPKTTSIDRMGISVKGKIVIARYYSLLARHQAQGCCEHGALAAYILDPMKMDSSGGDFPPGPIAAMASARQCRRHAFYPGGPLTPGIGQRKTPSAEDRRCNKHENLSCRFRMRCAPLLSLLPD